MKRIPVEVSEKEHKTFKEMAQAQFMTLTGLIRKLLYQELKAQKGKAA